MRKLKYLSIADNVSISIPTGDTVKQKSKTEPISQNATGKMEICIIFI